MSDRLGLVSTSAHLPGPPLTLADLGAAEDPMARSPLFRLPATRHHLASGQTAGELAALAAGPLFDELGRDPADSVDAIITNTLVPDTPITGCGSELAHLIGCRSAWIIDLHNGGCGAFPYMLKLASALLASGTARTALLCTVQNAAGQVYRQPVIAATPQSLVPGDGAGAAYLVAGEGSPIVATAVAHDPASAADMHVALTTRRYWEPGEEEFNVGFATEAFTEILRRGNRLVPNVVRDLCGQLGVETSSVDALITNQPNRQFLRNWRDDLGIDVERHHDTFDRFGNLYGAGTLITLDHASREGRLRPDDLVVLAGFAHAGDLAAGAAIRWSG